MSTQTQKFNRVAYMLDSMKYRYARVAQSFDRTLKAFVVAGLVVGGGASALISTDPADYTADQTAMNQMKVQAIQSQIYNLAAQKKRAETLQRQARNMRITHFDHAADLLGESRSIANDLNEQVAELAPSIYTNPYMTENEIGGFIDQMREHGFRTDTITFDHDVDPAGLKECRSTIPHSENVSKRASDIETCMKRSSPDYLQQQKSNYQILLPAIGSIGGVLLSTFVFILGGGLPYKQNWTQKPYRRDYNYMPNIRQY